MASIKDVAQKAGVGVGTVSRVLNNSGYVSDELLRSFHENVLFGNAAAIHPVYCSHSPVLLSVSKRTAFRAGSTGHGRLMPSRYLWWTILFSRCHGAATGTLCPWFDGHCSGALAVGPARTKNRGLGTAGHLRRVLHLFRQPCSNGSCPHTVRLNDSQGSEA